MYADVVPWLWAALFLVWWLAAHSASRASEEEPRLSRIIHLSLMAASFALLLWPILGIGPLAARWLPDTRPIALAGLGIEAAGLAFAIWARATLGRHWSGTVTFKEGHELVQRGPYAIVRHPIYTGLLLMFVGSALVVAETRVLVGLGLFLVALAYKIPKEEAVMRAHFSSRYDAYARRVKAIVPFLL